MSATGRPAMGQTAGALARAGVIVSAAFLASRVLGYVRVTVITAVFGATPQLDAFFAAFRIPDLIFQLVAAGALGSALVPVVAALLAHGQERRAWRVVSTVANLMLVALVVLAVLFGVAAPAVVPLITPGFDAAGTDLTIQLTRIMLVGPVFLALGAVASSLLNGADRFAAAAIAPIVYNLAIIIAALVLGPSMGVTALAIGVAIGSVAGLLVQLPDIHLRTGYRYEPRIDLSDETGRRVFALMVPRAIGLGAVQITFIVNTTLASGLGAGAITAYQVAFTILQLPLGLVAQPLGVVLLPAMSRAVAVGDRLDLGVLVDRSLRLLAYAMMLVTAVAIVLRNELVTLLFAYGRFDQHAATQTADTLLLFLVGLPAHSLIAVQARAFYAGQDTRTPVGAALLAVAINVVVSVLTVGTLGLQGLALGIALGAWAETLMLLVILARRDLGVDVRRELSTWLVLALGAALAALAAWATMGGLEGFLGRSVGKPMLLVEMTVATLVAVAVYAAYSAIARLEELPMAIRLARRLLPGRVA